MKLPDKWFDSVESTPTSLLAATRRLRLATAVFSMIDLSSNDREELTADFQKLASDIKPFADGSKSRARRLMQWRVIVKRFEKLAKVSRVAHTSAAKNAHSS